MNDGGPAFPSEFTSKVQDGVKRTGYFTGMTLRDWFAGMFISGVASDSSWDEVYEESVAKLAYAQADAMIEEREKGETK